MVCDRHQTADGFLRGIEARFDGGVDAGLLHRASTSQANSGWASASPPESVTPPLRAEEHTVAQQKSSGLFGGDLFAAQLHRGCRAGRDARAACIAAGAVNDRAGLHGDGVFLQACAQQPHCRHWLCRCHSCTSRRSPPDSDTTGSAEGSPSEIGSSAAPRRHGRRSACSQKITPVIRLHTPFWQ